MGQHAARGCCWNLICWMEVECGDVEDLVDGGLRARNTVVREGF
jgi:hypothetical protein